MRGLRQIWALAFSIVTGFGAASAAAQPCTEDMPDEGRYCGVPLIEGFGGPNEFGNRCLSPNDDGSSMRIDLAPAFPSGLRFFGAMHTAMFVNTNGNITFTGALSTYTPRAFPVAAQPMIAPFWADVDIRNESACLFGAGNQYTTCPLRPDATNGVYWALEPGRIVVTWDRVGFYQCDESRHMSFQLILTAAPGCGGEGDFDVEFRYAQCEWNTGNASGGDKGMSVPIEPMRSCTTDTACGVDNHCEGGMCFHGVAGQAGFDAGNNTDFVEIVGSRTSEIHRILCEESNVEMPGIYRFQIRGGAVICPGAGQLCDTGALGVCSEGRTQCVGGGIECLQVIQESDESCDTIDNDCDGKVDEGNGICADVSSTAVCESGTCVESCFEGGCPVGLECGTDGRCHEAGCQDVTCSEGEQCFAGECLDACHGIVCPSGYTCRSGRCFDLCEMLTCDDCTVCSEGSCVPRCQFAECGAGERCQEDGSCLELSCWGVTCDPSTECRGGSCVDRCDGVVCPRGETCGLGVCSRPGRNLPDAGVVDGDASRDFDASMGGDMNDAGVSRADAGEVCRGPSCREESPRSCACSAPGFRGDDASGQGVMLALLFFATVAWRRRR